MGFSVSTLRSFYQDECWCRSAWISFSVEKCTSFSNVWALLTRSVASYVRANESVKVSNGKCFPMVVRKRALEAAGICSGWLLWTG